MYSKGGGLLEEFKYAWSKPNNGLVQLIIINVLVFVALIIFRVTLVMSEHSDVYEAILRQLMLPASIGSLLLKPWTLITYFFTHENFFHIIFNMLFLYWFGKIIVEYLGAGRVISMYVIGGLVGGLFYILIYNLIPYFHEQVAGSMLLGASAGVFAVVIGAATFMPNYTFFLLFLGPVKIKYIAIFYVLLSFSNTIGSNAGGELAHLGGALMGFIFIRQLQRGNDIGTSVIASMEWLRGLFKPAPKIRVTHKSWKHKAGSEKNGPAARRTEQEEIDAILDKISHSGYESLSKEEKQKLFNASKK